ncbi:MAG: prepilin-type N-terminal cleavage/methylation domain-containing protein [Phycisphaerales bacterium]|nr:MAG: prepilin-type N-terminal cleavage/methylation domain-containing protein [Phycisphaerales bacterium]
MICRFEKRDARSRAFSLVEVSAAVAILAIVSSSVVLVISRCVASGTNSMLRMQAFEVARENMEKLLASDVLEETADYGQSELYPGIEWETTVETFYEPITARMWVQGISLARYNDVEGQEQTVELIHWLTDVTKDQLLQMMDDPNSEKGLFSEQLIETVEEAAFYAGVAVETVEQWLDNGMQVTDDGSFVKGNLDIYKASNGNPSPEDRRRQVSSMADLAIQQDKLDDIKARGSQEGPGAIDPKTGLTYEELEQMDFSDVYELMKDRER